MTDLERAIGYEFKDGELLNRALTHTSYANEERMPGYHNERLEFLGDSVLSLVVSEHLYTTRQKEPEGRLTRARAALVCEEALFRYAQKIGLGRCLFLGKGEEMGGGRQRPSLCADAFEALVAAVYLDGGLAQAKRLVLPLIAEEETAVEDYKTALQEKVQATPGATLRYLAAGERGPDHDKVFLALVQLDGKTLGQGEGRSKKAAEQMAAKEALAALANR